MLLVDDRERKRLIERVCRDLEDCESRRLPVADYLLFDSCGHVLAIERKAVDDLLQSIPERKLERQVQNLQQFDRQLLLIQGHWQVTPGGKIKIGYRESAWLSTTVHLAVLAVLQRTGTPMLWVNSEDEMVAVVRALLKQGQKRCWLAEGGE